MIGNNSDWQNKFGNNFKDEYNEAMQRKNIETGGAYQAKVSGDYGEFTASSILKALPNNYHIMNDILLQQGIHKRPYKPEIYGPSKWKVEKIKGRLYEMVPMSTQLDHLIVSPFGLFIIETKNHKGFIFGDDAGQVWTQVLGNGAHHFTFHNPVFQNETHLRELSKQIKVSRNYMTGMIVFTNPDANLSNVRSRFCYTLDNLYEAIMSYDKQLWSEKFNEKIILNIEKNDTNGYLKAKEHEMYVQDIKERKEINKRLAAQRRGFR